MLIVEDEASIRQGLADVLRFRGCDIRVAERGDEGLARAIEGGWDLVILDIMLPELNGFLVCEQLRASGQTMPVLMLTAKGDEDDIVRGFEVGADDYVTKPFGVRELIARVEALLRRRPHALVSTFSFGPFEIDPAKSEARIEEHGAESHCIALTSREVLMLRILGQEPGHVVSRRTLLQLAWGMNNVDRIETRTVDMHIANLRKKLGRHGQIIQTVRGQGYRLCG